MSFDAFGARLEFLQLLRKLNASSQSIQKVVSYAVKNGARAGDDFWACIMDESAKVGISLFGPRFEATEALPLL